MAWIQTLHDAVSLVGHFLVEVFALVVVGVDLQRHAVCTVWVALHEQCHRLAAVLHSTAGIDARPDLEDDIIHRHLTLVEATDFDDGLQANAGVGIDLPQSVVGQYTVLTQDGNDVRSDADSAEIQQRHQLPEGDAVVDGEGLHQLEAHTAAREMLVGVSGIHALGIEDGHRRRQLVIRNMMVTDDEVNAPFLGIGNLCISLDAAVKDDNQPNTGVMGVIDALIADAISLLVAIGDVEVDVGGKPLEETIDEGHSRAAIDIVVSIH